LSSFRFLVALLAALWSAQALGDTEILRGINKNVFAVKVETLDPESRKAGLNEASLGKVIGARLAKRKVGVVNTSDNEIYARVVVLTSNDVEGKVLGYGAHVEVSFRQKALLKRDKSTEFMAQTWYKGNVTVANPKQFNSQVVNALAVLVDQFLADYGSVNPGVLR